MRRVWLLCAVSVMVLLASVLSGCAGGDDRTGDGDGDASRNRFGEKIIELPGVEVREYKGERLDSVQDFRENSIKGPQFVDEAAYRLVVDGLVDQSGEYGYSEITSGFPGYEKVVQLDCVEGWSVKILWRGVLVRDILDEAGVQAEAKSVVFHATDGYTTSFPVSYFYDNEILLAYSMNGVTLPPERGFPFQLVAEDRWGYKWCKWVERIELVADEDPGGYWEDRGYSNSGERDEPSFGD